MQDNENSGGIVAGEPHTPASDAEPILSWVLATQKLDVTETCAGETLHGLQDALLVRTVQSCEVAERRGLPLELETQESPSL